MYPSMLARGSGASSSVGEETGVGIGMGMGVEPYYSVPVGSGNCPGQHWSQPTSPTPVHNRQPPNIYQHVHKDDESELDEMFRGKYTRSSEVEDNICTKITIFLLKQTRF